MKYMNKLRRFGASSWGKASGAVTGLMASTAAFASGSGSPGAAISGELAGGKSEINLVIAAIAVILGVIILWKYIKRAG